MCTSVGFIGHLRVSVLEHAIIESNPDTKRADYRLDHPLPGLVSLAADADFDIENLEARQLCHVPWLVVLHKLVEQFKSEVSRYATI